MRIKYYDFEEVGEKLNEIGDELEDLYLNTVFSERLGVELKRLLNKYEDMVADIEEENGEDGFDDDEPVEGYDKEGNLID